MQVTKIPLNNTVTETGGLFSVKDKDNSYNNLRKKILAFLCICPKKCRLWQKQRTEKTK